jgi:hypothetical protein
VVGADPSPFEILTRRRAGGRRHPRVGPRARAAGHRGRGARGARARRRHVPRAQRRHPHRRRRLGGDRRPPPQRGRRDAGAHPGRGHLHLRRGGARRRTDRRLRGEAGPRVAARPRHGQRRHLRARARGDRAVPPRPAELRARGLPGLLEQGAHVEGWVGEGVWADLGTPERFLAGHRRALDGELRWPSLEALSQPTPASGSTSAPRWRPTRRWSRPCCWSRCARRGGRAGGAPRGAGPGTEVAAGAELRDCVLFDGVRVGRDVRADGALVGHHARLGPDVRVEREVIVGDGVAIDPGACLAAGTRRPRRRLTGRRWGRVGPLC